MALVQEVGDLACLRVEVALADLGPVLHLLDLDVGGLLARFLGPLGRFVLEVAVVHDPAHRRVGLRGHLDEVEAELTGDVEGFWEGLDPDLLAVGGDQADFPRPDAVVDPELTGGRCGYAASLPARSRRTLGSNVRLVTVDRPGRTA